ncbi:MAG: hypothetical protein WCY36_04375 [Candidatus Omnitrophota bacterium]
MMTGNLYTIIAFVLATSFAGFNIVIAYDRKDILSEPELAGLAYLFGIGAIALELFLFGLFKMKFVTAHILLPWVLLAIINIPRFKARFRKNNAIRPAILKIKLPEMIIAALLIFVVCYAFFIALIRPVESYDAVAIWSLKAKVIYMAGTVPPDFFNIIGAGYQGAHPDYPLLLPLSQVWFYTFIGNFNDHLVKVLFPLNFLAFLIVFYMFLRKAGAERIFAMIFTFLLASVRQFFNYATNGYADMQIAIYASLTFLALYLWIKTKSNVYFWTAFFACLFAMWTKNEGSVVFLSFVAVLFIYMTAQIRSYGKIVSSYGSILFATALLSGLLIAWSLFKGIVNVQNDVVNAQSFATLDITEIFKRALAIFYEYQRQAFGVKYWNLTWVAFIFMIIAGFGRMISEDAKYVVIPVFFILACYTAVYFITPNDIGWQLRTTTSRLLLHVLPLVIFYLALSFAWFIPGRRDTDE